jgi:hypothetical protein
MSFLLMLHICSASLTTCGEPIHFPVANNHYDCTRSAYIHSINLLKELGKEEVNNKKIFITFTCKSVTGA